MKIEAGRFYRTRDGRKVGPMRPYELPDGEPSREFIVVKGDGRMWHRDGHSNRKSADDLIAEWTDEPADPTFGPWIIWNGGECPVEPDTLVQVQQRGQTRNGAEQSGARPGADWAWWHDLNDCDIIAYRVQTQPKVETVMFFAPKNAREWFPWSPFISSPAYRLTITIRDGIPDPVAKVEAL